MEFFLYSLWSFGKKRFIWAFVCLMKLAYVVAPFNVLDIWYKHEA